MNCSTAQAYGSAATGRPKDTLAADILALLRSGTLRASTAWTCHAAIGPIAAAMVGQSVMLAAITWAARRCPVTVLTQIAIFLSLFTLSHIVGDRIADNLAGARNPTRERARRAIAQGIGCALASGVYLLACAVMAANAAASLVLLVLATGASVVARRHGQALIALDRRRALTVLNILRPAATGLTFVAAIGWAPLSGLALASAFTAGQVAFALAASAMVASRGTAQRPRASAIARPHRALDAIGWALVPLSLPLLFPGSRAVAMFWLAASAVSAPGAILAAALRPTIRRAVMHAGADMPRKCLIIAALLAAPALAGLAVLAKAGDPLSAWAFGPGWAGVGRYALVLGALAAFEIVSLPFLAALPALGMQRKRTVAGVCGVLVRGAVLFGHPWSRPELAVAETSLAWIVVMAALVASVMWCLGRPGWAGGALVTPPDAAARPLRLGLFADSARSAVLATWLSNDASADTIAMLAGERGLWRLARTIAAQDIVVIGGGLRTARRVTTLARLSRRPVIAAGLSIGPLRKPSARRTARATLRRLAWVSVRDPESAARARALLGAEVAVLPDPALACALPVATTRPRIVLAPAFAGQNEAHVVAVFGAVAHAIHQASPARSLRLLAMGHAEAAALKAIARPLIAAGIAIECAEVADLSGVAWELHDAAGLVTMQWPALAVAYGRIPLFAIGARTRGALIDDAPAAIASAAMAALADQSRFDRQQARRARIAQECKTAARTLAGAVRHYASVDSQAEEPELAGGPWMLSMLPG